MNFYRFLLFSFGPLLEKYVTSMINGFTGAFAGARCICEFVGGGDVARFTLHVGVLCASEFARVSEGSSRTAQVSVQG